MKQKNKKKIIILAAVVLLIVVSGIYGIVSSRIPVETALVDSGEVVELIKESGTVESEGATIVTATGTGEIQTLLVSEGDEVKAGDLLLSAKGTAGAQSQVQSMKAELSALQIQYNQARNMAEKNKTLYESGALSQESYTQSRAAADQLAAQVSALSHAINSYSESADAPAVTASIDGVISEVFVKEGQVLVPGTPLFEIFNPQALYVKADMVTEDADLLEVGAEVRAYNDDTNFIDEKAFVRKIYPKAQEKMSELGINQRRVPVEIELSAVSFLRLGRELDLEIIVARQESVLRIPDIAIFEKNKKDYVFVVEGGKALLREIETGLKGEYFTEIQSGLSQGETVIVSPGNEIEEGVRVKS